MTTEETLQGLSGKETLSQFVSKIAAASLAKRAGNGDGWVETTQEIVDYFNPQGLGSAKYFVYGANGGEGIFVCVNGQKEAIQSEMELSSHEKAHGTTDGVIG